MLSSHQAPGNCDLFFTLLQLVVMFLCTDSLHALIAAVPNSPVEVEVVFDRTCLPGSKMIVLFAGLICLYPYLDVITPVVTTFQVWSLAAMASDNSLQADSEPDHGPPWASHPFGRKLLKSL